MRGEFDSLRGNKNGDMTERLGAGLQNLLGRFDSYYHLNGFGGNPRVDDESMSTKFALVANRCRQLAFNQWGQVQLLTGVQDVLSLYVYK